MKLKAFKEFRKHLHANPELSGQEFETKQKIIEFAKSIEPSLKLIEFLPSASFALYLKPKKSSAGNILLRAELDALPIQEWNKFQHKSQYKGVSHKCGHDGHATTLLFALQKISKLKSHAGVYFLFQSAEETGQGALAIKKHKLYKKLKVQSEFALHNVPGLKKGVVYTKKGLFSKASSGIIIQLKGVSTHASTPHLGVNPSVFIAELINFCKAIEENDSPSLATIIYCKLGEIAFGTSAHAAELGITFRANSTNELNELIELLTQFVTVRCKQHQLKFSIQKTEYFAAIENSTKGFEIVEQACKSSSIPFEKLEQPFSWSEDFGNLQSNNGCFFALGAGEKCKPLHHEAYDYPDDLIAKGASVFEAVVKNITLKHG